MTEQEAKEMIQKISDWLANGAPGNTVIAPFETAASDLARDFSHALLEAADADGMSGCRLCQA
jgi:hypothetical protein